MATLIALLDDEPDRIIAMLSALERLGSNYSTIVFDNAPDMIAWFASGHHELALICLDHDLGPNRLRDGRIFDPGIGRDVADYLSTLPPFAPVIVHTTNHLAAPGMIHVLEESGWQVSRVSPYRLPKNRRK